MSETVTIKITKGSRPAWYAHLIGEQFECYFENEMYLLKGDKDSMKLAVRYISKGDCEVVETAETNKETQ